MPNDLVMRFRLVFEGEYPLIAVPGDSPEATMAAEAECIQTDPTAFIDGLPIDAHDLAIELSLCDSRGTPIPITPGDPGGE